MDAASPSRSRVEHRDLKQDCWRQILRLLSHQDFQFTPDHWPYFTELVSWHHILIDVLPSLAAANYVGFDEQQIAVLEKSRLNLRKNALKLCQVQTQLSEQLSTAGIRHLFFKGIVLSQWLYESPTLRQCRDIDLIVHPKDHAQACSRLDELGYVRIVPKPELSEGAYKRYQRAMKDVSYLHQESKSVIELHWALRPFTQAFLFDFDTAYRHKQDLDIEGSLVPAFSDLLHARYIAAHGCLSHWARLRWLLDWRQLAMQTNINWVSLINSAASNKERHYMLRAFALANKQLGLSVPEAFTQLDTPLGNQYCVKQQMQAQAEARYPSWARRQLLNLFNQQDLAGMAAYSAYMMRKALAADSL